MVISPLTVTGVDVSTGFPLISHSCDSSAEADAATAPNASTAKRLDSTSRTFTCLNLILDFPSYRSRLSARPPRPLTKGDERAPVFDDVLMNTGPRVAALGQCG